MSARRLLCLQVGEIVGNDGNDHHVEHVVQQERDADDHQNELSLPVGVLHRAAELFSSFTHFRQLQDGRFRQTDRVVRLHDYVKARSPLESFSASERVQFHSASGFYARASRCPARVAGDALLSSLRGYSPELRVLHLHFCGAFLPLHSCYAQCSFSSVSLLWSSAASV